MGKVQFIQRKNWPVMNISVISSAVEHPVNCFLERWVELQSKTHDVVFVHTPAELKGGDLLLLISCSEIIAPELRKKYLKCLLVHASDLPQGRGWSPCVWTILSGGTSVVLSLLEADDHVDTGAIWRKLTIEIPRHLLFEEINEILFTAELELMTFAVENWGSVTPAPQSSDAATYLPKRNPCDSRLDPKKTIEEQFDLIRVCDPSRYPAFFELNGRKYSVRLEVLDDE